jgi:hypothetical protein
MRETAGGIAMKTVRWLFAIVALSCSLPGFAGETLSARKGTVVFVDTAGGALTLQPETGDKIMIKVEGSALPLLPTLRPGDRISWTYRHDITGQPQAVIRIRTALQR